MTETKQYFWHDLGKGNDRVTPIPQMLKPGGVALDKVATLKGEKTDKRRPMVAIYNRYYVIKKLATDLRLLLSIPKDEWLELSLEIWESANAAKEE
jgi:hypothetical protein